MVASSAATGTGRVALSVVGWGGTTLKLMSRNRVGFAGFLVVVAILAISWIGPVFVPFNPNPQPTDIYQAPSLHHLLGTDAQGRDVLVEVINGGRSVTLMGFEAAVVGTAIAVLLGTMSAFIGGALDAVLSWLANLVLTVPHLVLVAVLAGFVSLNEWQVGLVLGILGWPTLMRAIRSQVFSIKERPYVDASRGLRLRTLHILLSDIAPSMSSYIAIHFALGVTGAIYAAVGLMFLGLLPVAGDSWGTMLNTEYQGGALFVGNAMSAVLVPMAVIAVFQLAMVAWTRSLAEVFDPRLRRSVS